MDSRAPKVNEQGAKVSPKGAEMESEGSQKVPKASQKGAKGSQKGAKSEPKVDQGTMKRHPAEGLAKRCEKGSPRKDEMGPFWEPFSIKKVIGKSFKNQSRKALKINAKRLPKWSQNRCQNASKIDARTGIEKDQENHENSCFTERVKP
jgi:hypothetical protein